MSQSFKTSKTKNNFSELDIIMAEQLKDVIILLDHDMSREDIKSSYDIVKKYGIRFKDIQIKDRRKLVKVVLESKLKEMKNKNYNEVREKRKRGDEEDKKEMDIVKKIGKKVKKEARGGNPPKPNTLW